MAYADASSEVGQVSEVDQPPSTMLLCTVTVAIFSVTVVLVIQIMAEPLVQNTVVGLIANQQRGLVRVIVRGDMRALMQQQLDILTLHS